MTLATDEFIRRFLIHVQMTCVIGMKFLGQRHQD
jgi:hypothetical protein